jgi:hypothetical protein
MFRFGVNHVALGILSGCPLLSISSQTGDPTPWSKSAIREQSAAEQLVGLAHWIGDVTRLVRPAYRDYLRTSMREIADA